MVHEKKGFPKALREDGIGRLLVGGSTLLLQGPQENGANQEEELKKTRCAGDRSSRLACAARTQ